MKRILVIEDTEYVMEEIVDILRIEGFAVEQASDGQAGLILAREMKPELVISDLLMPVMDGFVFLKAIREGAETHNIPVIVLSAKSDKEGRQKALDAGASSYMLKPVSPDELISEIKKFL